MSGTQAREPFMAQSFAGGGQETELAEPDSAAASATRLAASKPVAMLEATEKAEVQVRDAVAENAQAAINMVPPAQKGMGKGKPINMVPPAQKGMGKGKPLPRAPFHPGHRVSPQEVATTFTNDMIKKNIESVLPGYKIVASAGTCMTIQKGSQCYGECCVDLLRSCPCPCGRSYFSFQASLRPPHGNLHVTVDGNDLESQYERHQVWIAVADVLRKHGRGVVMPDREMFEGPIENDSLSEMFGEVVSSIAFGPAHYGFR